MEIIKNFARKVLQTEIEEYRETISDLKTCRHRMCDEKSDLLNSLSKIKKENADLKMENEILRKYYDLDKEPSDEIKAKIHIDLEINRLKQENLILALTGNVRTGYSTILSNLWDLRI